MAHQRKPMVKGFARGNGICRFSFFVTFLLKSDVKSDVKICIVNYYIMNLSLIRAKFIDKR